MLVFICHYYAANPEVAKQRISAICRSLVNSDILPIAPQLFLDRYISEATERELAISICKEYIIACGELWICSEVSNGMKREIKFAKERLIPVMDYRARFIYA